MADQTRGVIEDSDLDDIQLKDCTIIKCKLRYAEIRPSTISDSSLYKCNLRDCVIKDSDIEDCTAHETKFVRCGIKKSVSTKSPLALRKFPPEIRVNILEYSMFADHRWNGLRDLEYGSPAVLVALRPDPDLYAEALQVFYSRRWFDINPKAYLAIQPTSSHAFTSIRQISIE